VTGSTTNFDKGPPVLNYGNGSPMNSFTCLSCRKVSHVSRVMVDAGSSFLICEWCHAENAYRAPPTSPGAGEPPDIEITGVRRALRLRADGTVDGSSVLTDDTLEGAASAT
jgi:hypothetical protein